MNLFAVFFSTIYGLPISPCTIQQLSEPGAEQISLTPTSRALDQISLAMYEGKSSVQSGLSVSLIILYGCLYWL